MADAQKKRRVRWQPNTMQMELLERMFIGGPILHSELTPKQVAALKHPKMRCFVEEGCEQFPWRLTAEGNYYMGGDFEADYSDSEEDDDDR